MEVLYDLISGSWAVCEITEIQGRTIAEIQENGGYFKSLDYALEYADIVPSTEDTRDIYCLWNSTVCEFVRGKRGEYLPLAEGLQTDEQRKWWFANLYLGNINSGYLEKLAAKKGYKFDNSNVKKTDTSNLMKMDKSDPKKFYDDYIKAGGDPKKFYQWQKASMVRGNNNELLGYKQPSDEFKLLKEDANFKENYQKWYQDRIDAKNIIAKDNDLSANYYSDDINKFNRGDAVKYATATGIAGRTIRYSEVANEHPELKLTDEELAAYNKSKMFGVSQREPSDAKEAELMKSAYAKKDELDRLAAEKVVDDKMSVLQRKADFEAQKNAENAAKNAKFTDAQKAIERQGHYTDVIKNNKAELDAIDKRMANPPKELVDAETRKEQLLADYKQTKTEFDNARTARQRLIDSRGLFKSTNDPDYLEKYQAADRAVSEANTKWANVMRERDTNDKTIESMRAKHIADSISGDDPNTKLPLKVSPQRKEVVGSAKDFLSRALNGDRFNESLKNQIGVKTISSMRAFADADGEKINLSKYSSRATTVHELGHIIEARDPIVHQRCVQFLESRADNLNPEPLHRLTGEGGYGPGETAYKDTFIHPYTGKVYKNSDGYFASEVLSMGFQHMYEDPSGFRQKDPDHFAFTALVMKGKM